MLNLIAALVSAVVFPAGRGAVDRISRRWAIVHAASAAERYEELEREAMRVGTGLGIGA